MKLAELQERTPVGGIVARFQGNYLHEGHIDLIETVKSRHGRVLIFLGCSTKARDNEDPIDYRNRAAMIREKYPDIEIFDVWDNRCNKNWSKDLDKLIQKQLSPGQKITLYGSRDSFVPCYQGRFPTITLEPEINISATMIRKQIQVNYPSSEQFRAGMIYATALNYPVSYQAVDVAIFNEDKLLLVKKPGEVKWRFVGGFAEPDSGSLEEDAKREAQEETGLEVGDIQYVGSAKIDDWRYRKSKSKIKSALFTAQYVFGRAEGADDVEFAKWFLWDEVNAELLVEEHGVLFELLKKKNVRWQDLTN